LRADDGIPGSLNENTGRFIGIEHHEKRTYNE